MIQASTLQFLKDLKKNNDRDWFNANKARFVEAQDNVAAFTEGLMQQMSGMDQIEMKPGKKAMMRIYRDVRLTSIGGGADEVMIRILTKFMGIGSD